MALLTISEPNMDEEQENEMILAIDLGTTNSLIAFIKNNEVEIIADENGNLIHPSIVAFSPNGQIICGQKAVKIKDAEKIYSIKRLMGKGADDFFDQKIKNVSLGFKIKEERRNGALKILINNHELSPIEISAEILKYLKNLAEKKLDKKVKKVIITVPAYFDEAARSATKNAAILADLEVVRLLSEPTAAALAYGLDRNVQGLYMIFDLGGGTFDISVLNLQKGVFKVIGVGGDAALGGDDFDNLITQKICQKFSFHNLSIAQAQELKIISRSLKEQLSNQDQAQIDFNFHGQNYNFIFSKNEFEELIEDQINQTINITDDLLVDLDLTKNKIDGVILVGGTTRTPLIRQKLAEIFGKNKILTSFDPEKVVVMGAALQAQALSFGMGNLLLDVIPLSLGIETMGGIVEKIIKRNSTIPASAHREFTTYIDGQKAMKLHIVQGERELADNCRSLAYFEIKDLPPLKAGTARIGITFNVDADGILTIVAEEKTTGKKQIIEVKPSFGLDEQQIKSMLLESAQKSGEDLKKRLLIEAKITAQRNILAIKNAFTEDANLQNYLEKEINDLQKKLEGEAQNYQQIENDNEQLEKRIKDFYTNKS